MVLVVVYDEYLSGVLCNVFNSERPSRRDAGSQKALLESSFFSEYANFSGWSDGKAMVAW